MPADNIDLINYLDELSEVDLKLLMAAYDVFYPANDAGKLVLIQFFLRNISKSDRNLERIQQTVKKVPAIKLLSERL